jgi:hypothetical protein
VGIRASVLRSGELWKLYTVLVVNVTISTLHPQSQVVGMGELPLVAESLGQRELILTALLARKNQLGIWLCSTPNASLLSDTLL